MRQGAWSCIMVGMAIAAATSAAAVLRAAAPQGASTTAGGVYSDAQSQRGEATADKSCASCHGPKLSGSDIGPTLQGDYFMGNWKDMTAGALFDKIQMTMPADAPGSLTPAQTADLIAYIFKLNGFPAGTADLPSASAALGNIKIAK